MRTVYDASDPGDSTATSLELIDDVPREDLLYLVEPGLYFLLLSFLAPNSMIISGLITRVPSLVEGRLPGAAGARVSTI